MYLMTLGALKAHFSLQLKPDSRLYQVPLRCVAYVLQKPFKDELERLQQQDIIAPLGVDEMSEWCSSSVLVPKANWYDYVMFRPSLTKPGINKAHTQGSYAKQHVAQT